MTLHRAHSIINDAEYMVHLAVDQPGTHGTGTGDDRGRRDDHVKRRSAYWHGSTGQRKAHGSNTVCQQIHNSY
jgi:hypothetical protein